MPTVMSTEDAMRTSLARSTLLGAFALAGVVAGLGGKASAADIIRYGIDDERNINRLPQVVAEREGFFDRKGLRVEILPFATSFRAPAGARPMTLRDAMAKGESDMAREQLPLLINDVMAGGGMRAVSVASANPVYSLLARPEIKSFADLKGKTIAITAPLDGITIWTRKLLAERGLGNDDVTLKRIAGSEDRRTCLKSGDCAAASLAQPANLDAIDAGAHTLGLNNELGPMLYQVDIANPAWAAAHREAVIKYIRATAAAVRFIQEPRNHDEVIKVTSAYMKEPEDRSRAMLAAIWDPKNRVLPPGAAFDMAGIEALIGLLGEYGALKAPLPRPERFIDPSYAEAAR
jgi:ABC-type nitrate/sulfonate/bicarbonate transport system substrate-binding protein